jgi:NADPH:quinone reductase-like Zn-dependent oxidoreductase
MQAVVRYEYGSADRIQLASLPEPTPGKGQVLVRVRAVSLNASDVESLTGRPLYTRIFGLLRPNVPVLGTDLAGVVEAVGPGVTRFRAGDEVLGDLLGFGGTLSELTLAPEKALSKKPAAISFEEAGCLPQAGAIAYQGILQRSGELGPGKRVLINGGGGGSGTLAIQLAKGLGAHVTGVDSARKQGLMRELGADRTLDYAQDDYTRGAAPYDLILDLVGNRPLAKVARVVAPGGRYWLVGGSVGRLLSALILGPLFARGGRRLGLLIVEPNRGVPELLERCLHGTLRPIIGGRFALSQARDAFEDAAAGRALGKLVVQLGR